MDKAKRHAVEKKVDDAERRAEERARLRKHDDPDKVSEHDPGAPDLFHGKR